METSCNELMFLPVIPTTELIDTARMPLCTYTVIIKAKFIIIHLYSFQIFFFATLLLGAPWFCQWPNCDVCERWRTGIPCALLYCCHFALINEFTVFMRDLLFFVLLRFGNAIQTCSQCWCIIVLWTMERVKTGSH